MREVFRVDFGRGEWRLTDQEIETLRENIGLYLKERGKIETFEHCISVGDYAAEIGNGILTSDEIKSARIAGYLHDISAIYPNDERITVAKKMEIEILEEEGKFPLIIHQKISRVMAERIFNIKNEEILSAIECHTTLKKNFSKVDVVLFVADKIKWDQRGEPPYKERIMLELKHSFERSSFYYIDYILNHGIKIPHPWLLEAHEELKNHLEGH